MNTIAEVRLASSSFDNLGVGGLGLIGQGGDCSFSSSELSGRSLTTEGIFKDFVSASTTFSCLT